MRKTLVIALGAAVALVTAAVAIAVVPAAVGVSEATAKFATTKTEELRTGSCTADGKTWQVTSAHYTGAVTDSANAILNGPLTIHARTTYSTTDSLGYVEGSFKVRDDDSRLSGKFSGTLQAGKLVGFLTATSRGNHAKVLGNISATFDPAAATAFTSGALGSTSTGALAVVAGPACKTPKPEKPAKPAKPAPKPKKFEVKGTLAINGTPATSVTVTAKGPTTATCNLDGSSPALTGFANGDRVEMKCEGVVNNTTTTWMLRELKKHK